MANRPRTTNKPAVAATPDTPESEAARAAQERAEQIAEVVAAIEGTAAPDAPTAATPEPGAAANDPRRVLWTAWRRAAGSDAPTVNQLVQGGLKRVDVDAIAGYVAVVTEEETWRAIGLERALVVPLVAMLTGRGEAEITALLAKGPAKIEPATASEGESSTP